MKIPPVPLCFESFYVFFSVLHLDLPPCSQGNLGNFVEKIQGFLRCAQMDEKAKAPLLKDAQRLGRVTICVPGEKI
jgi:hypothetical protein